MISNPMSPQSELMLEIEGSRDEAVVVLQTLVRFPSITGDEAAIGAFVADYCRALGLAVEIVEAKPGRPNVIATWDSGLEGPTLLLNDHLDIVPPGPLSAWTYPPFDAVVVEDRVYGRGTIDTKSGLTTLLIAVRAARSIRLPIRGKLVMIFTCDEETGGRLGMQHLGRNGYLNADMAVVAEPTSMRIEIATKGRLSFEIETSGTATHGARPWLGHNAINDMSRIVLALEQLGHDLASRPHARMGRPSLNVGTMQGGTVPNMVPNWCRVEVDRRLVPGETREQVIQQVQSEIDALRARHPYLKASIVEKIWWPGYMLDESEPIIDIAARAFEQVVGCRPEIGVKDAGTDASWIHNLAGIPVIMFSPGDGPSAMNADENVSITDMMTATKVIGQIIADVLVNVAT
ncbi:MAG: M20 family metallopeptidase [Candidatus Methylopumilus sp.]|jgi:acetylornithine deacetylase/succinyl-diaminopimelate desuccinylase family protein